MESKIMRILKSRGFDLSKATLTPVKVLAMSGIIVCVALLGISVTGDFTPLGNYESLRPRAWESFDPELASRTRTMESFIAEARRRAKEPDDAQLMQALYDVTKDRFTHHVARHTLYSNWLLWINHKLFHPQPARFKSPEDLLANGHSGLCGQVSIMLTHAAREVGLQARIIELGGHTVMESYVNDSWRLYDPDAEVAPQISLSELVSTPGAIEKAYPGDYRSGFRQTVRTEEDNRIDTSQPRLIQREKNFHVWKYLFPVFGIVIFLALIHITNGRKVDPTPAQS